jgi:hypothetical protein
VLDRLAEIGTYYRAALTCAENLKKVWAMKGSYWDAGTKVYNEGCQTESAIE